MIGVVIQARLGSTRLPGKVLKMIGKKTLLEHIMYRLSYLKTEAEVVVVTSTEAQDDELAQFCESHGYKCFRGSEQNVLERYYLCSKQYGFTDIVRLTADNPFVDVEEIDRLIEFYKESGADYAKSFETLPYGVGAEIFSFAALDRDYRESSQPHHFEHVNEYILENPQIFKTVTLQTSEEKNHPTVRLTVDTKEDYDRACFIVENSTQEYVTTQEAIRLCSQFA